MELRNIQVTLEEIKKFVRDNDLCKYGVVMRNCNHFVKDLARMLLDG